MQLNHSVFDVWAFRRRSTGIEYLVLQSSELKAARFFNSGQFWQIPSGVFHDGETVPDALERALLAYELTAQSIWAAEHAYTIYNRRFDAIQIISVYAVEVDGSDPRLNPAEHSTFQWLSFDAALNAVHYRGLKDGLRSVREYITDASRPAPELCLRSARLTQQ
jgi:ADP-ribose pyrophosphatase YjhB (NUDIX family)